jgi:hypothetical protein
MKFRSSSVAALFTGTDGLTAVQQRDLDDLLSKIKLTEKQAEKRDELLYKRDREVELPEGAKTYIEELVNQEVYKYKVNFGSKETDKGTSVEDDSIELYNRLFFKSYKKLVEGDKYYSLEDEFTTGHPDVVDTDNQLVIDIKSSFTKKTFPKFAEDGKNSTYEWQVKDYLRKLGWTKGKIAYCLVNTPEELLNEWDEQSLHYMDDVEDRLRVTVIDIELTPADVKFMEGRLNAAYLYANEYRNKLNNK